MIGRKTAILGPLAFLNFVLSFLAFAASSLVQSHAEYDQRIGMEGAPNASGWNWIGFGLTGLLALVFAWGLRQHYCPAAATAVAILVAIAGAG